MPAPQLYKAPTEFTEERREVFYKLLAETGLLQHSAWQVGVHPKTEHRLRLSNEEHAQRVEQAMEEYRASIEAEIYRRAIEGVDKPLYFQGRLTGDTIKEYSDHLLIVHAKRHIPEYRDKVDVNQTTRIEQGGPAPLDVRSMTHEQREALRVLLGPSEGPVLDASQVEEAEIIDDATTVEDGSNTEEL